MPDRAPIRARLEDRYVVVLLLIVASIAIYAVAGDHQVGEVAVVVTQSVALVVMLQASRVSTKAVRLALVGIAVALVFTIVAAGLDQDSVSPGLVGAALALVGPPVIVRRLRDHSAIDFDTVAGSLCIYLLIGLFFAYVYRFIDATQLVDGAFFAQRDTSSAVDYVYFSFVTITTVGYGDLTARSDLGRMLAVCEALLGQLYLVGVVAVLVGNMGRQRRSNAERAEQRLPVADGGTDRGPGPRDRVDPPVP